MKRSVSAIAAGVALACLLGAAVAQTSEKPYRLAGFGNSLMGCIQLHKLAALAGTRGHELVVETTGAAGAPMPWLWNHKTREIKGILDEGNWDGILLQPFLRPLDADKAGARNFIDYALRNSPGIKVYVYAQFINDWGLDYQTVWNQDVTQYVTTGSSAEHNVRANRTRGYYEALTREIRSMYRDLQVVMVPVGHAFALLDEKIQAGRVPGVESIYQLYADATHTNNFGNFLTGMTWYAVLFNESPVGLPIGDYQGDPEKPYTCIITDEQARILQKTAWAVAATHPLAGVTGTVEVVRIATPAIHPAPIVGEEYRKRLQAVFGHAPYEWSVIEGKLPDGLALTDDGTITGTPTSASAAEVTVQVAEARDNAAEREFTVTAQTDTAPRIALDSADLGTVRAGEQVRIDLRAEDGNGRLRWEFADARTGVRLMHGLRLRGSGTVVGAVGIQGTHEFPLRVVDADPVDPESDQKTFTLTVEAPAPGVVTVPRVDRDAIRDTWVFMRLERAGKANMSDYIEQFTFPEHPVTKVVAGPEFNNKAAFQLVHNGGILYTVVHVHDDEIVVSESDPVNGDSVEVFFDIYNDREKVYNADDRHAIITPTGQVSGAPGRKSGGGAMRTEQGYFAYLRMPSHDMKRKLEKGAVLGFDVAVNDLDADDGPVTRVYWRGDMRNAQDTTNFGTVILE